MIRSAYFAAIADFCKQTFATQNFLMSQIFANIAILSKRRCCRAVECTGLENRRRLIADREFESHRFRQFDLLFHFAFFFGANLPGQRFQAQASF